MLLTVHLCAAICVLVFLFVFNQLIEEERELQFADYSSEVALMVDLAEFIKDQDRNRDHQVEASEYGKLLEARPDIDTDNDRIVSRKDARIYLRRIAKKRKLDPFKVSISFEDWERAGGNPTTFQILDHNEDGNLTRHDLELDQAIVEVEQDTKIRDERSGGSLLVLDQLRSSWLKRFNQASRSKALLWKNQKTGMIFFGRGKRVRVTFKESGKAINGFISAGRSPKELTLLDDIGKVQRIARESVSIEDAGHHFASEWFRRTTKIRADDWKAWKALALDCRQAGLGDEAENAAKKALIYQPTISELLDMLGLELHQGKLRQKK